MKQKRKTGKKLLSFLLTLAMLIGLVPGMSLKAQAAPAETLLTTITPTGIDTYSESTAGVVNVTLSDIRRYSDGSWRYGGTVTVTQKEGYTITKCLFNARAGYVEDAEAPFSIDVGDATYVRSVEVYGYQTSSKTTQTVTPPTADTGLTYKKDQAQALLTSGASVTTGNTAAGSIQYKVGTDGTWSTEIPKGTNAGTYSVYYKVLGDNTYAEYAPTEPISVYIAKADPETPTGMTGKYGQKLSTVSLPGGWSWADGDTIMSAGVGDYKYKANYNPTDATNYNTLNEVDLTVKVGKGDGTISFAKTEVESTIGVEPPSVYFENTGNGVVTFTSDKENVATVDEDGDLTIIGVGETTITASVVDSATYQYATNSVSYKLIVNKRSVSIKTVPTASEITYGQTLADSKLSGGEVFGNIEGTFSWADSGVAPAVSDSETTEYAVKFTPKNSDIYAESTCNVKVKVKKAAAPATKESLLPEQKPATKNADDLVYTGEPIELVTAPTNPLEGYKVQYSKDNGTTWTDTIPTETNVGTYTVKVKYVSDNYENIDLDDITVEITTVEKAAFNAEKEVQKKTADNLAADGDSDASKKLIEDAKKAIDELAYDETKSLDENKAALVAIVSKLKDELTAKRAEEKKEADDTAAAKKVNDAINALPASDKIATTDKEAIEAARKAYDALTDDQKAKVPADTLKKLEEAEKELEDAEQKEAEKEAADTEAAKKVTDAINALPASDKIATTDKEAIEAARKAYDALTEDQKAKVPAETLKKLEDTEKALADAEKNTSDDDKKDEDKPDYKNEWVDGQWYGADGNTDYEGKGTWKSNETGWWYEDTTGWYPVSQWQKIDGKWYYFTADGYMDYSEYRDGYWLGSDGAWDETYSGGHWMQDSTGWWYVDATGWYPVNQWLWIDGSCYYFYDTGYMATNTYVGSYWVNANGNWE